MPLGRRGSMDGGQALTAASFSWKRIKLARRGAVAASDAARSQLIRGALI